MFSNGRSSEVFLTIINIVTFCALIIFSIYRRSLLNILILIIVIIIIIINFSVYILSFRPYYNVEIVQGLRNLMELIGK